MALYSKKSISELVRYALLGLEKDFTKTYQRYYNDGDKDGQEFGYEEGLKDGMEKGMNDWAIWVTCCKCYKTLYIKPNSTQHDETIRIMNGRINHDICPRE